MTARIALVLALAVCAAGMLVSSCATFRALPIRDQVLLELDAAEWGVKADHDFGVNWLSDADVAQFEKLDGIVRDVAEANPPTAKAAAHQAVVSFEARELASDSKLRPYLDALAAALA